MSQIYAAWNGMNLRAAKIDFAGQKLDFYNLMLSLISNDLPFSYNINRQIKSSLNTDRIKLNLCRRKISKISNALGGAAKLYKSTEAKLETQIAASEMKIIIDKVNVGPVINVGPGSNKSDIWDWSDTWKLVGQVGIIGSIVSTIGGLATGGISVRTGLQAAKDTAKVVGNIAKSVSETGSAFDWKYLWGINEKFSKTNVGNVKTTSSKVATGAKWAGHILTGIITTYDNFTDTTENNSTGRKIAESIGESAVKIGVTAGVSALIGLTGAPVVVAGAATVLVTWGIDKICEAATGKDLAEFVSDTVLDKGAEVLESVGDAAGAVGKAVGKAVGSTAKKVTGAISGWWKKAFG